MSNRYSTLFFTGCLLIALGLFVYFPGLNSQFQFDDYPNIVVNERLHIQSLSLEDITKATLSGNSGFFKRPISMLSFALNYNYSQLSPFAYKLTNLIIHLLNSLGIYWLSLLLFKKAQFTNTILPSLLIAISWSVHPINLTSVLYIVQRMTSLSASFVILGIILFIYAKEYLHHNKLKPGLVCLILVLISGLAAVLTKENGALVFVYLLLINLIFYQDFFSATAINRWINLIFFGLTLALPLLLVCAYSIIKPEWITAGYVGTAYSLTERLLTESRIVWYYILWILLPNNQSLGLFHDDIALSHSFFDETLPIAAVLTHGLFIAILVFLWVKRKQPLLIFGCALFYSSHLIESTIFPLELAHEHRNYLGSFGILLALFSCLFSLGGKIKNPVRSCIVVYILILALLTTQRATDWGNGLESALIEVAHHPRSSAAHFEAGRQYSSINGAKFQEKAYYHFKEAAELDKTRGDALFAIIAMESSNKRTLDPDVLKELKYRLRTGPAYASNPTWLSSIVKCYTFANCDINEDDVTALLQAALDNPKLAFTKLNESYTLIITSGFLTSGGNNYKKALEFSITAANSSPGNVIFIKNIIDLSTTFKDFNTAKEWIKKLEESPFAFLSQNEIQSYKSKIPIN